MWRLGRLGRSLRHLIETVTALAERKIAFRSLTENIDTTAGGKLVFHLFGSFAEFERDLIRDRTMVGLTAARARGRIGGRPPALTPGKLAIARQMSGHGARGGVAEHTHEQARCGDRRDGDTSRYVSTPAVRTRQLGWRKSASREHS